MGDNRSVVSNNSGGASSFNSNFLNIPAPSVQEAEDNPPVTNDVVRLISEEIVQNNNENYQSELTKTITNNQTNVIVIKNYFGILVQEGSGTGNILDLDKISTTFKNSEYDTQSSSVLFKFKTNRCNVRVFYDSNMFISNANTPESFNLGGVNIVQCLRTLGFGSLIPRLPICLGATAIFKSNLDSLVLQSRMNNENLLSNSASFAAYKYQTNYANSPNIPWGIWIIKNTNYIIISPREIASFENDKDFSPISVRAEILGIAKRFVSDDASLYYVEEMNNGEFSNSVQFEIQSSIPQPNQEANLIPEFEELIQ